MNVLIFIAGFATGIATLMAILYWLDKNVEEDGHGPNRLG
jgi:hypothetical protein